jgi:hypothetical protein
MWVISQIGSKGTLADEYSKQLGLFLLNIYYLVANGNLRLNWHYKIKKLQ